YRRSLGIYEKVLGKEHISVANSLNNLATLLQDKGDYQNAEPFYRRSLGIYEKVLGKEHISVANSLNNLASLLSARGNYEDAEPLFRRALLILEKVLGNDHPDVANILYNLGILLTQQKRTEEGKKYLLSSFDIRSKNMNSIFPTLTERQQEGYLNLYFRSPLNAYLSVFTEPSEQKEICQNLFIYRGITSRTLRNRTRVTSDPNVASLFAQLKDARTFYANLYLSPDPKLSLEI
ncbi:MAG: tetratricopeptide repeat protein, partial [Planctomycetota bacterium]